MHPRMRNVTKKSTGIYRCVDEMSNLKVRIRIDEVTDECLIKAAKFEVLEAKTFRWQQKILSRWERDFYRDENNCVTDLDRRYHKQALKTPDSKEGVMYTYVNTDEFCLRDEPVYGSTNRSRTKNVNYLDKVREGEDYAHDMIKHIEICAKDPFLHETYDYMYIVADFGEYVDDTWVKSEYVLCTIKYDSQKKILIIYPDFTGFHKHRIIINGDKTRVYEYSIENVSENANLRLLGDKEKQILHQVSTHENKLREQMTGVTFATPPSRKLLVFLFCEILTARDFDADDIHVRYFLDLPECWSCADPALLKGSTQTCRAGKFGAAYFGYPFDVVLSCDLEAIQENRTLPLPHIYFEIVSKGSWDRYRTEGLTYTVLPILDAGNRGFEMHCFRILPGTLSGNLKRFFIGDYGACHDDITWIARPKEHDDCVLNKYGVTTVGTGELTFRTNVVHQSRCLAEETFKKTRKEDVILEKLASSSLLKSTEKVIEEFKTARRNMMQARLKL